MPEIICRELADSRRFTIERNRMDGSIEYVVFRSNDEAEIVEAVFAKAPKYIAGLALLAPEFVPQGGGVWFVTCKYGILEGIPTAPQGGAESEPGAGTGGISPPTPPPPPAVTETGALTTGWSFNITGGTEHITSSLFTRYRADDFGLDEASAAPDFKKLIGVTKEGPQGCEIKTAGLSFSTTRHVRAISMGYIKTLKKLACTTNNAPFWTYATNELLFLGASGTYKGPSEGWEITYMFEYEENRLNFNDGFPEDFAVFPNVQGHDYVWMAFKDSGDMTANRKVTLPLAVYCEQVYRESNFGLLGLGN